MLRQAFLALANSRELKDVALNNRAAQVVSRRFVAGERLSEALALLAELNKAGITGTLDHLGESVADAAQATASADTYLQILDRIAAAGVDTNISVKLTQMGLEVDEDLCYRNVTRIVERARDKNNFVRIDMESSAFTERTLTLFRRLWHEGGFRNIGIVLQAYLYRSEADVREMNSIGARVRLCKGAYNEPAGIAFPKRSQIDANYARLARLLLTGGNYPALATHDGRLIDYAKRYAAAHGIDPSRFEFQMLYGIRRELAYELARQGYNMRVYIPFGHEWYPYFMRRLAERPANMVFVPGMLLKR